MDGLQGEIGLQGQRGFDGLTGIKGTITFIWTFLINTEYSNH